MENLPTIPESAAKVMAATSLSQTLSFCMERKYLEKIGDITLNPLFCLKEIDTTTKNSVSWIEIIQIGKPLNESSEECFTAIQKILYSCFMPKETQLLFLITGNGKQNKMYLGVRPMGTSVKKNIVKYLNEFLKGAWPGLQSRIVKDNSTDENLLDFSKKIQDETFEYVYALTGIPSMESQYKSTYPATVDKLMAGMMKSKNYAYLVIADPIESNEVDGMLFQCREMNGQAESLKSFNLTEGRSEGSSRSHSTTDGTSSSTSESVSKRDYSKLGKLAIQGTGIGLAASFFPAAQSVLEGAVDVGGQLVAGAVSLMGFGAANSIISSLTPSKSTSTSNSTSHSETDSISTNEGKSQSLSRNIVSKHIESVSEHLFYHSKRLETGKAIGMWRVGVYLLAEKESDAKGGAMQLRSILSGQESIFEPIRITDISNVIEPMNSLAQFVSPIIRIDNVSNGHPFNHPLGDNYKELKSVLTTKELSYLINFPLRSVPGISVIDSTPDFSLNPQEISDMDSIAIGNMLYGGSITNLPYRILIQSLAKHTLLSGINGSGKTNTVQAILNHLDGKIPFLVIEPAKTEYVDWAIEYNKQHPDNPIKIFIPGCKVFNSKEHQGYELNDKLRINPFEVVWLDEKQEPNVLTHIDRLKSTFAAAFPMYDILPVLMEELIYTIYQNKTTNWMTEEPVFGSTLFPTLNSMSVSVDTVISNMQYEERVGKNMKACLHTRINSLKRGWKGEMLNVQKSTEWKDLFDFPCIINLSYVGDDIDKAFFMALVLQFLYEYRTAHMELGQTDANDNSCKHLCIIEEAHRVMMNCTNPEQPQYKSAMMFSNMLSEIRAYGQGLFLVDQVPTRLIPDAIKNTNLKIVHRLVAEDDCKAIGESMGLGKEQRKIIPKLRTGQCLIAGSTDVETYWVQVDKVK